MVRIIVFVIFVIVSIWLSTTIVGATIAKALSTVIADPTVTKIATVGVITLLLLIVKKVIFK